MLLVKVGRGESVKVRNSVVESHFLTFSLSHFLTCCILSPPSGLLCDLCGSVVSPTLDSRLCRHNHFSQPFHKIAIMLPTDIG